MGWAEAWQLRSYPGSVLLLFLRGRGIPLHLKYYRVQETPDGDRQLSHLSLGHSNDRPIPLLPLDSAQYLKIGRLPQEYRPGVLHRLSTQPGQRDDSVVKALVTKPDILSSVSLPTWWKDKTYTICCLLTFTCELSYAMCAHVMLHPNKCKNKRDSR